MGIEQEIIAIRAGIKAGRFSNEASVSQGIVLRLLNALGWPTYDTDAVWPEYSLGPRRVDFALCSPPSKPIAFIEVKQIGQGDGAERQLFEYAFHIGVPLAILTDGQEWNFFLPAEQGDYGERRVYRLDLSERNIDECADRLNRYLLYSSIVSGQAIDSARSDYRNISKDRQMLATLPKAWRELIADADGVLVDVLADRVASLCGFRPDPDMVAGFLRAVANGRADQSKNSRQTTPVVRTSLKEPMPFATQNVDVTDPSKEPARVRPIGFEFEGHFHECRNAIETLRRIFGLLISKDPTFAERFAGLPKHGRTRRYLAKDANDLYRDRPDLVSGFSEEISSGWWLATNLSRWDIDKIIRMACDVAQITYGRELTAYLGG